MIIRAFFTCNKIINVLSHFILKTIQRDWYCLHMRKRKERISNLLKITEWVSDGTGIFIDILNQVCTWTISKYLFLYSHLLFHWKFVCIILKLPLVVWVWPLRTQNKFPWSPIFSISKMFHCQVFFIPLKHKIRYGDLEIMFSGGEEKHAEICRGRILMHEGK